MAQTSKTKCPSCGAESTGKFCHSCGAPLGGAACPACGAAVSGRARFCPECGGKVGAAGSPLSGERTPWIVAGISLVALVVVVVVFIAGRRPGAAGGPADQGVASTDITQLGPREQADRLFDRVARADEAGDTAEVAFFAPMAFQAYANPGVELDADARLHLGLMHLATGDPASAGAQADTVLSGSSTHLYGLLLRVRAAQAAGDSAAARRALRAFAAAYDSERAKGLPEYAMHDQMLVQARDEARRAGN